MSDTFNRSTKLQLDGWLLDQAKYMKTIVDSIAVRVNTEIDVPVYTSTTSFSGNTNLTEIVDTINSNTFYRGENRSAFADTSSATWRICRVSRVGQLLTTDFVGDGKFDQVWDDRVSLFPVVVPLNTHSILLDGGNDKLNGLDIHQFDNNTPFTISIWVKPTSLGTTGTLFAKTTPDANVYGYSLRINATTGALFVQMRAPSGLRSFTFNSTLSASVWQNVIFTYNGGLNISGAMVYVDSVKDISTPGNGTINNSWLSGQDFTVGARNTAFFLNGAVNQMTIWNKEFSQSECTELFLLGAGAAPSSHSAAANNTAWNKLGTGDSYPDAFDNAGTDDLLMINTVTDDSNIIADVP